MTAYRRDFPVAVRKDEIGLGRLDKRDQAFQIIGLVALGQQEAFVGR